MKTKNKIIYTLDNVSLRFPIFNNFHRSLRSDALNVVKKAVGGQINITNQSTSITALKNLTLKISKNDRIGLYGHNGSGKSSLLRLLAGIYEPTSGRIDINGKIHSMLDLTSGMEEEATGKQNIILKSYALGMTKNEINDKIQEIVDFSELSDFIDLPIKIYSSGMKMRLAFSISTAFPADILLLDEWLSVGDDAFSKKAEDKLNDFSKNANAFVLASQNLKTLEKHCNRIFELNYGNLSEMI